MSSPQLLTLVALLLAVVAIALFLITVIAVLHVVSNRLNQILGAVGEVVEKTGPLEPIITEISDDLTAGQGTIEAAVGRLQARKGVVEESSPDREPAGIGSSTATAPPPSGYRNY